MKQTKAGNVYGFKDDELYRIDGPVIEYFDGTKRWYIDGEKYSEKEFNQHPLIITHKEKALLEQSVNESQSSKKIKL